MVRYDKTLLPNIIFILLAVTLLLSTSLTFAQSQSIPPYINYQGRLIDQASGAPVNGVKNITFALYDAATGGTPIYSQSQPVTITNGSFSVYLGKGEGNYQGNKVTDGIPAEVFTDHSAKYLGIKMADSPTEMKPRQVIASVAYAYKAEQAESAVQSERAREAESLVGQVNVNSTGNVGIGTASPSEKLQVDGNIKAAGTVKATSFEGDGSKLTGMSKHSLDAADGDPVDAVYVDNAGKVGIGTTSPEMKLEVVGGHARVDYGYGMWFSGPTSGAVGIRSDSSVARNLNFATGGSWGRMVIDDNGKVGIGTTNPSGKLNIFVDSIREIRFDVGGNLWSGLSGGATGIMSPNSLSLGGGFSSSIPDIFLANVSGNVGIGTTSPSYKLHVIGDIAHTGGCFTPSDLRLKENITPLTNAIDKVSALRGIYFNLKGESTSKREVGVIAQEVEAVLPEVVSEDAQGYKSVDYSKFAPLLIEAVKELKTQNEALKALVCKDHPEAEICQ
jgi:hypothetical protein